MHIVQCSYNTIPFISQSSVKHLHFLSIFIYTLCVSKCLSTAFILLYILHPSWQNTKKNRIITRWTRKLHTCKQNVTSVCFVDLPALQSVWDLLHTYLLSSGYVCSRSHTECVNPVVTVTQLEKLKRKSSIIKACTLHCVPNILN